MLSKGSAIAIRFEAIATRVEAIASKLEAIAIWRTCLQEIGARDSKDVRDQWRELGARGQCFFFCFIFCVYAQVSMYILNINEKRHTTPTHQQNHMRQAHWNDDNHNYRAPIIGYWQRKRRGEERREKEDRRDVDILSIERLFPCPSCLLCVCFLLLSFFHLSTTS